MAYLPGEREQQGTVPTGTSPLVITRPQPDLHPNRVHGQRDGEATPAATEGNGQLWQLSRK
jgi:hypothetical protein